MLIELGATGLVLKNERPEVLMKAIRKVHGGEVWLDRTITARVLARIARRRHTQDAEAEKIASLTRREHEIIALVGEGLKNGAIADRLFVSEATVRNHLTSILSKLGLSDRFELAVYAFRHGFPLPEPLNRRRPASAVGSRPASPPRPISSLQASGPALSHDSSVPARTRSTRDSKRGPHSHAFPNPRTSDCAGDITRTANAHSRRRHAADFAIWTIDLLFSRHMPRRTAKSDAYGIRRRALAVLAASLTRREHEIIKV